MKYKHILTRSRVTRQIVGFPFRKDCILSKRQECKSISVRNWVETWLIEGVRSNIPQYGHPVRPLIVQPQSVVVALQHHNLQSSLYPLLNGPLPEIDNSQVHRVVDMLQVPANNENLETVCPIEAQNLFRGTLTQFKVLVSGLPIGGKQNLHGLAEVVVTGEVLFF